MPRDPGPAECCRSKHARLQGMAQTSGQLLTQPTQEVRNWGGEVHAVEFVDAVSPYLGGEHDPLIDQAGEAAPDPNFRAPNRPFGNVTGNAVSYTHLRAHET